MKRALVMAGGTGGHIFPGLAVAQALRDKGWDVQWLGGPNSMESRLVPPKGFTFNTIDFGGVRGKGVITLALLPLRLLKAFWQSIQVVRRVKPDVVIGMGGYITFPAGMMAVLLGKPLILHEQNSVAGMANKVLAGVADRVFTTFPHVFKQGEWIGNPLRAEFLNQPLPEARMATRQAEGGPWRLLVMGGSLGAKALNEVVPQAIALMPADERPQIVHQSGEKQIDELRANYATAGVEATLVPFIDNTAQAMAEADIVICRAGASTVAEIAAVGVSAILVPFPFAVDDHQTTNARYLADAGAATLVQQRDLTAVKLAKMLSKEELVTRIPYGLKAKKMQKISATEVVVEACQALTTRTTT
jgi:UDP-N-acetylglucosamine--N-acetylmuramyl-(pentapeptide) pyrophosphoryl-undecaprenol N-acetylglucosamine transferase